MNILCQNEIYQKLQSMFNQETYWTILEIDSFYDVLSIGVDIKDKKIKHASDVLLVEVEKQIISFVVDKNDGFHAIIKYPDDAIMMLYYNKNRFLRNNLPLYYLFETKEEAEKYLKNVLLYKVSEMENLLNLVKLSLDK